MTREAYQKFTVEEIRELPPELLVEIADFVLLVRKRFLDPKAFDEELEQALLERDLKQGRRNESAHLEQEFIDYDEQFPVE